MNKVNYDKELDKIILENRKRCIKPKLLLHCCCAPCSSTSLMRLKDDFEVTCFFYNPNIDSVEEYVKRERELKRFCNIFNIKVIDSEFKSQEFYDVVKGYEECREGGERCFRCYRLRLNKTAEKAKALSYDYFATTLTLSPLKNAEKLNKIGYEEGDRYGVKYLPSDFKKKSGYLLSIELSKEYNLYRQNYCGCVFSKNKNSN